MVISARRVRPFQLRHPQFAQYHHVFVDACLSMSSVSKLQDVTFCDA